MEGLEKGLNTAYALFLFHLFGNANSIRNVSMKKGRSFLFKDNSKPFRIFFLILDQLKHISNRPEMKKHLF